MSEKPERSPRATFMDALGVPWNAKVGVVTGLVFAAVVYVLFVVVPEETREAPELFLVLALVVAASTAILVATALTVRNAVRATMSPPKWIRTGGRVTAVGAGVWALFGTLSVAVGLGVTVPDGVLAAVSFVFPVPVLAILYGAWAVHAVNRSTGGYPRTPREVADSVPWLGRGTVAALVGGVCFWTTAVGVVLVAWIALVEANALLGLPTELGSQLVVGIYLLALLGTSLLGGAALRADAAPRSGTLPLVFAGPIALAVLTALAFADVTGLVGGILGLVLGLAWLPIGVHLANERGIPPDDAFESRRPDPFRDTASDSN